jgi:hypothetical protein
VAEQVTVQSRGDALRRMQCAEGFKVRNVALHSNILQQGGLLEQKNNKNRNKEKRHQRHNLTVLSSLPVARSGAVG